MKVNRCIFLTSEYVANIGEYPRLPIFLVSKQRKEKCATYPHGSGQRGLSVNIPNHYQASL